MLVHLLLEPWLRRPQSTCELSVIPLLPGCGVFGGNQPLIPALLPGEGQNLGQAALCPDSVPSVSRPVCARVVARGMAWERAAFCPQAPGRAAHHVGGDTSPPTPGVPHTVSLSLCLVTFNPVDSPLLAL